MLSKDQGENESKYSKGSTPFYPKYHYYHLYLKGSGDVEDHAILLCSLLLGFGLKAFVVCGVTKDGLGHYWVLTKENNKNMFWESMSGDYFEQKDRKS